jgi:hypothetical protein
MRQLQVHAGSLTNSDVLTSSVENADSPEAVQKQLDERLMGAFQKTSLGALALELRIDATTVSRICNNDHSAIHEIATVHGIEPAILAAIVALGMKDRYAFRKSIADICRLPAIRLDPGLIVAMCAMISPVANESMEFLVKRFIAQVSLVLAERLQDEKCIDTLRLDTAVIESAISFERGERGALRKFADSIE